MIIVKIIGGLGNQMFQYAYAMSLADRGCNVKIDITAFETYSLHGGYQLNQYKINLMPSSNIENRRYYKKNIFYRIMEKFSSKIIKEKSLLFDQNLLEISDDKYIIGYFQSEKYFKNLRELLLGQFVMNEKFNDGLIQMKEKITTAKNSCSLHIRRGDYISDANINTHGSCDLAYYYRAIEYMQNKFSNLEYFIFSDDMAWVEENLKLENVTYVNTLKTAHEDMYCMSLCKHNIIANSTFSWWGAWLNTNEKKIIIAPKKWFSGEELQKQSTDIVPSNWIRL